MRRFFKALLAIVIIFGFLAAAQPINKNKYFEIIKNIEIFTNLYKELNTYYVDEVDPGSLMRTGIEAIVESLDPFTNYISESDIEGYRFRTEGQYHGIGALSAMIGDYITITELYKDQPADQAGLKVGDQLLAVNGQDAKGKTPEEVNNILQGFPGTEVVLTVNRPGQSSDLKIKLVRGQVNVPNVPYSGMVDDEVGYVALTTFTRNSGLNVSNAIETLRNKNPKMRGVILDLRDNGGGLLTEAVNLCNIFIPKGELVVTTKGKVKEWDRSFETLNTPLDVNVPVAVLINKGSASASEIVSGVLQDYDRGVLIGQRSYGKGLVQNTRDVGYNARVKLTTAKYYIPSGRCIQSVQYDNGEPVDIPDEKRTKFTTRNGRTVLDGGGIKPDIYLEKPDYPVAVSELLRQNILFDYVTEYCLKHDSIADIEQYKFTDFAGFVKFAEDRNFSYKTENEKMLDRFVAIDEANETAFDTEISEIRKKIKSSKQNAIESNKATLVDLIEKEIAGRYYYQKGKTQMSLRNDLELKKAIEVLKNKEQYQQVLRG